MISNLSSAEALIANRFPAYYEKSQYFKKRNKLIADKLKEILEIEVIQMMRESNMLVPPFEPFKIFKIGKSKIKYDFIPKNQLGFEATIKPFDDGFHIQLDDKLKNPEKRNRLRSTLAHEIMHTFFYDVNSLPPQRLGYETTTADMMRIEEDVCRYLARQFLIPRFSIRNLISHKPTLQQPSSNSLRFLKHYFGVSADIIAYRMIKDLELWDCVFVKSTSIQSGLRTTTKLKSKSALFKKIKLPRFMPSDKSTFSNVLLRHIAKSIDSDSTEIIDFQNNIFKLETSKDTAIPLTFTTFITTWKNQTLENSSQSNAEKISVHDVQ